uniref:Protein phosphatase 1, regulatory subunit 42 n=1 Tax=Salmo trutta TaxID=8032 RepID=A0A673X0X0_SALTR
MVRLTMDLIAKSSYYLKNKRSYSLPQYLKLTHLNFSNKNIEDIEDLSMCRNLTVLYLYDNKINHVLGACPIIMVMGGLEELKMLYLEGQRLPSGEKLLFDPRTLFSLAESFGVLNINRNNIDDVRDLAVLKKHTFLCCRQPVTGHDLEGVFSQWPLLHRMDLSGNTVCHKPKYRDSNIVFVEELNGKEINELSRQFLINWKASKDGKKKWKDERMKTSQITLPLLIMYCYIQITYPFTGKIMYCYIQITLPLLVR